MHTPQSNLSESVDVVPEAMKQFEVVTFLHSLNK